MHIVCMATWQLARRMQPAGGRPAKTAKSPRQGAPTKVPLGAPPFAWGAAYIPITPIPSALLDSRSPPSPHYYPSSPLASCHGAVQHPCGRARRGRAVQRARGRQVHAAHRHRQARRGRTTCCENELTATKLPVGTTRLSVPTPSRPFCTLPWPVCAGAPNRPPGAQQQGLPARRGRDAGCRRR